MAKVARKKFQEALKALKQACKNERLPFTLRIRAAELICAIYGVPLPESNARTKRAVRELVTENAFDRHIRQRIRGKPQLDETPEPTTAERLKSLFDEVARKEKLRDKSYSECSLAVTVP